MPVEGQEIAAAMLAAKAELVAAKDEVTRAAAAKDEERRRVAQQRMRAAIDAHEREWNGFWRAYGGRLNPDSDSPYGLLDLARKLLQGNGGAEDLVQKFLMKKVMLKPNVVFGPVSRGERPLWLLLRRSLINFAVSEWRRRVTRELSIEDLLRISGDEVCARRDPESEVAPEDLPAKRLQCIREAFDGPSDLLCHLLLKEQLVLLQRLGLYQLQEGGIMPPEVPEAEMIPTLIEVVEILSPWSQPESEQQCGPRKRPLGEVWTELSRGVTSPGFDVSSSKVELALGLPSKTWNTYVMRARHRVVGRHGVEKVVRLFPDWPPGVFSHGDVP